MNTMYLSFSDVMQVPEGIVFPHGFSVIRDGVIIELEINAVSTVLPRPNVSVVHSTDSGSEHVDVKVERDGKSREYHGKATSVAGAVGEVVRDILNDPVSAEWLP